MNAFKKLFPFTFFLLLLFNACSYLPEEELVVPENMNYQETTEYIKLSSTGQSTDKALLFIPGGLVAPQAYISLMQPLVEENITIIILKVSANLAILELSKATKIQKQFPEFATWYVAGHSLGGISAQSVIHKAPDLFDGLILLGTYPAENFAIPDWHNNVLSVYAENDLLSAVEEINTKKVFLPPPLEINNLSEIQNLQPATPHTLYYLIEGGNHGQFGNYGMQNGDGIATISVEEQHAQTQTAILNFINWNESL